MAGHTMRRPGGFYVDDPGLAFDTLTTDIARCFSNLSLSTEFQHADLPPPLPPTIREFSPIPRTSSAIPQPLTCKRKRPSRLITEIPYNRSPVSEQSPTDSSSTTTRSISTSTPPDTPHKFPDTPTSDCSDTHPAGYQAPPLRRKRTPRKNSLRELRALDSEADLRRAYEDQTEAYLNGSILTSIHGRSRGHRLGRRIFSFPEVGDGHYH